MMKSDLLLLLPIKLFLYSKTFIFTSHFIIAMSGKTSEKGIPSYWQANRKYFCTYGDNEQMPLLLPLPPVTVMISTKFVEP